MRKINLAKFAAPPVLLALVGVGAGISAQNTIRPDVPAKIAAPMNQILAFQDHAKGVQIYSCDAGPDHKPAWVLKAPDAELFDSSGKSVGRHFAGPTWKHNDGSQLTGKAVAREDAPEPDAIPWLLVTVTGHAGNGVLARISSIQRVHTKGGQPPATGCDDAHRGAEVRSPYSADYYFYTPVP